MPRAERSDADADEEPGVIPVQAALLHHVVGHVARGSTGVKFIAHLVSGHDRGLLGREGDATRIQCVHEIAVDGVGTRGRGGDRGEAEHRDDAEQCDGQERPHRLERAQLGGRHSANLSAELKCEC